MMKRAMAPLLLGLAQLSGHAPGFASEAVTASDVTREEAYAIGREAYDYYYPLLIMDLTRTSQTTVTKPDDVPQVPINGFWHWSSFPDASYRQVVRPNFDTLYSMSWLDLSNGPVSIEIPADIDRYHVFPLTDMWTNVFAVLGSRTLGRKGGKFMIASKTWNGSVASDVTLVRAPTDHIWLIGRIQTNTSSDYEHVRRLQHELKITAPAASPAVPVESKFDHETPPVLQLANMSGEEFIGRAAVLAGRYSPQLIDQPILARLARIGFHPGESYDLKAQPAAVQEAVRNGLADASADLRNQVGDPARKIGGWLYDPANMSAFGGDYHQRALVAQNGLGALRPEDAIYPSILVDESGVKLDGRNRYVLHFEKDKLPPSEAFWSLTAYDDDGFPIQTPEKRYSIGDRDQLAYNADGSLDLYMGSRPPVANRRANWLPTDTASFNLVLRIYSPGASYRAGLWRVPPITKIED